MIISVAWVFVITAQWKTTASFHEKQMYQVHEVCFHSDTWEKWDCAFPAFPALPTSMKPTRSWETLPTEMLLLRQRQQRGLWGVLWTPDLRTFSKSYWNQPYHCKGDCANYKILSFHEGVGRCCLFPFLQILAKIPNTNTFSNILPQLPTYISQANINSVTETGRK